MGGQEHFYLETNVTLAVPREEDGEMELFISSQSPSDSQVTIRIQYLCYAESITQVRLRRLSAMFKN